MTTINKTNTDQGNDTTKMISIAVVIALIFIIGAIFVSKPETSAVSANNVEIRDGVQYITINAKGGYFPQVSTAQAGIPTKLIMKTEGSFDCSSALVIPDLDYQAMLPQTGETEIDIGTPKANTPLQGTCGMGMY